MTPSIAADESAMAESIKRRLATQGKSSDALTFADVYSKFSSKTGPGSVKNKWAVLYLLKTVSEDRKIQKHQSNSVASSGFLSSALSGGLPELVGSESNRNLNNLKGKLGKIEKGYVDGSLNDEFRNLNCLGDNSRSLRGRGDVGKGWSGGVLMVSKDPENLRDMAYKEFVDLSKEENEVSEEVLVRDVLYACQGMMESM